MRLIDADALLDRIPNLYERREVSRWLDDAPTVDAVPVVHGRWIDETFKPWGLVHHPYKCDQCGEHSEAPSDYCPHCGARMDEKGDGNG